MLSHHQAGYQITQYHVPLATGGHLEVSLENDKREQRLKNSTGCDSILCVQLQRLHLEQDSGKVTYGNIKDQGWRETLVDLNRAGLSNCILEGGGLIIVFTIYSRSVVRMC